MTFESESFRILLAGGSVEDAQCNNSMKLPRFFDLKSTIKKYYSEILEIT